MYFQSVKSLLGDLTLFADDSAIIVLEFGKGPTGDSSPLLKEAVCVGNVNSHMAADLLEEYGIDGTGHLFNLRQPLIKSQEAHTAALPTIILE